MITSITIAINLNDFDYQEAFNPISDITNKCLTNILNTAKEAQKQRDNIKEIHNMKQRIMKELYIALLDSPNGLTKDELLIIGESNNLQITLSNLRIYLKKQTIYNLSKHRYKKEILYYLDPKR